MAFRLDQPAIVNSVKEGEITETGDLYSQVEPVWEEITDGLESTTQQTSKENDSTDEGCQRQQVVVRKRDSFNSKARPVSTASVDGKNTGIKAQGSVKKKDARPPSIAESDDSVVLSEAAGSNTNDSTRFNRRQPTSAAKPIQSESSKKDSSPESSLSSYSNDFSFPAASMSVTCSNECHLRMLALEAIVGKLKERVGKLERLDERVEKLERLNERVEKLERLDERVEKLERLDERVGILEQKVNERDEFSSSHKESEHTNTRGTHKCDNYVGYKFTTDREKTSEVVLCLPHKLQSSLRVINSTPFFSDHEDSGYQLCLQRSLHESKNKQSILTFSFVIMNGGKCDDKLPWPFNRQVTLVCSSSKNDDNSLTRTINPKPSRSYERPTSVLNKPVKFLTMSLDELEDAGFISDNKITFFVTVV